MTVKLHDLQLHQTYGRLAVASLVRAPLTGNCTLLDDSETLVETMNFLKFVSNFCINA